jgi:hypothetical protein
MRPRTKIITDRLPAFAALAAVLALAACTTATPTPYADIGAPLPQLTPVPTGTVQQGNLPPVGSTTQMASNDPNAPFGVSTGADSADPLLAGNPQPNGSFVTLNDMSPTGSTGGQSVASIGGPLSVEDLLGGWTVSDTLSVCRLNLTYTAKGDTGRYRASAPGCDVAGVAAVASWQLAGSEIQLYNEPGQLMATLLLSGGRFVGTMSGGRGISMER